jgi:hypothetical protein
MHDVYRYDKGVHALGAAGVSAAVGRCRLNQVDPCPITYDLSNP